MSEAEPRHSAGGDPAARDQLAPGYRVRHPTLADAEAIVALIAAAEIAESGEADGYSREELEDEWRRLDPRQDAWVVAGPDGALAGYGYLWSRLPVRIDAEVYVHPEHVGHGIGTTLVRRSEARASEHARQGAAGSRVILNNWINARNPDAVTLLEREGYEPARYFWRMEASLDEETPHPSWPAGFAVRGASGDADVRPFYETLEEAMADHWGHAPASFDEWVERRTGATFDPSLWFLVLEGTEPAGAALCSLSDGVGWVETLAVRRSWRRRGLGLALLRHAFRELARRGARRARLGVDAASPTGATRLYERAGMRVVQEHATMRKALGDG